MSNVCGSHIREADVGASVQDGIRGRDERHGRGQRLAACGEAGRDGSTVERGGARRERNRLARASDLRQAALEGGDPWPRREPV